MGVSGEGSTRTKGPCSLSCCECMPMLVSRYRPCCRSDGYEEFNKDKGDRM